MLKTYRGDSLRFNATSSYTFVNGDKAKFALTDKNGMQIFHTTTFSGGETSVSVEFTHDEMKNVSVGYCVFECELTISGKVMTQQATIYVGEDDII